MENNETRTFPNFDPTNDLSQIGKQRRMKRGLGAQPLLESEIKDAQNKARSAEVNSEYWVYHTTHIKNMLESMVSLKI